MLDPRLKGDEHKMLTREGFIVIPVFTLDALVPQENIEEVVKQCNKEIKKALRL